MKLTAIESRLMALFVKRGPAKEVSTEALATAIYGRGDRPKYWRGCVLVRLRSLRLKLMAGRNPYVVNRVTPLGRSNEAKFALERRA
tara:strand:+ start:1912 stop:2172 length:261 start_codon:yes stop_codon:yes gene_type:complete